MLQTENKELVSTLNDLIQTCADGRDGFESAAAVVDSEAVREELLVYSKQRGDFITQLQSVVMGLGESPAERGSISAALHRGWINLRSALSTKDTYAVLAECERGEDSAVASYRSAIEAGVHALPTDHAELITMQYAQVKSAHDRVRAMRDARKPK